MSISTYIDAKLIKYNWYKTWRANRSRKRLEREAQLTTDVVEVYDASAIAEREKARLLAERLKVEERRRCENVQFEKDWTAAEMAARLNPERTKQIYEAKMATKHRFIYTMEHAFENHIMEHLTAIVNERNTKKS